MHRWNGPAVLALVLAVIAQYVGVLSLRVFPAKRTVAPRCHYPSVCAKIDSCFQVYNLLAENICTFVGLDLGFARYVVWNQLHSYGEGVAHTQWS